MIGGSLVQNVMRVWAGLDARRQVLLVLAAVAMIVAVVWLSRLATQPRMTLLYGQLEPAAAGEVIASLDQQGAPYDVRGNAIYVPASERDTLRISLAGQGLPANGSAGFEMLDNLPFGTTAQMFDAVYRRAVEGELARTISASAQVRAARVHIANPSSEPFRRDSTPTASVIVTPAAGSLGRDQGQALRHLVAAAVPRLTPDNVSVIDSTTSTLIGEDGQTSMGSEVEREAMLEHDVIRMLEAHVGPGRAFVEVSIETETDREALQETIYDPEGRVTVSSVTRESTASSQGTNGGGEVTVASNLPDGDANSGGGETSSQQTETEEQNNFETSMTLREVVREPGGIRRMTVAVLIDADREIVADGSEVAVPRTDEELGDLRELVASAVGYNETRGDQITIKSLPLTTLPDTEVGSVAGTAFPIDTMQLAQLGILAAVALALGLFVVRPILTSAPAALPAPEPANDAPPALTGEIDDGFPGPTMNTVSDFELPSFGDAGDGLPALGTDEDDAVARLKNLITERQDETMEILRSWMGDSKERIG
ncbi:MAG: flagellar basal-body MS-ring/collar protein FliF [Pseudomonadota bacterium]